MAKAYKCDGCGRLISNSSEITSNVVFCKNNTVTAKVIYYYRNDTYYSDLDKESLILDFCDECALKIIKNMAITGGV